MTIKHYIMIKPIQFLLCITLVMMALFFTSCSDEPRSTDVSLSQEVSTQEYSLEEKLIAFADQARNDFGMHLSSRSECDKKIVSLFNCSRSSDEDIDSVYIVNYGNNSGYVIIHEYMGKENLIGVTEQGNIASDEDIIPPVRDIILKAMPRDSIILPPDLPLMYVLEEEWNTIESAPKVSVRWGQTWPTGYHCPNGVCGCNALACAMTLSHFQVPTYIQLTYDNNQICGLG